MEGLTFRNKPKSPFRYEAPVTLGVGVSVHEGVEIGAHTYVNGGWIRENVTIGRFCSIGYNVSIGIGPHPLHLLTSHPFGIDYLSQVRKSEPTSSKLAAIRTVIGHDVWVGQGATVLQGVTVSTGSVIGAGAVVTKNVPPYAIVGGVPARVIRFRFDEDIVCQLIQSEWWLRPIEELRKLPLDDIQACIDAVKDLSPMPISYIEI